MTESLFFILVDTKTDKAFLIIGQTDIQPPDNRHHRICFGRTLLKLLIVGGIQVFVLFITELFCVDVLLACVFGIFQIWSM